jgi:hypothetical protein
MRPRITRRGLFSTLVATLFTPWVRPLLTESGSAVRREVPSGKLRGAWVLESITEEGFRSTYTYEFDPNARCPGEETVTSTVYTYDPDAVAREPHDASRS